MRISEFGGEDAVIRLIGEKYGAAASGDLLLGIGDDAALIRTGTKLMVVTTDLLIENTHFRMDINEPYLLGWKSAAVNISDIAAMGGEPGYAFVSIGLPDIDVETVEEIYDGLSDACRAAGCALAGGDTVGSPAGIVINVTVLGEVEAALAARRIGASVGDAIIVTNTLGDSRAGLELLLQRGLNDARNVSAYLVERHLKPVPRVREALAAVSTRKVRSMMDLSDGLSADLARLCLASRVGAWVYADRLPVSPELDRVCGLLGWQAETLAASGGEDYELLLTCAPEDAAEVVNAISSVGTSAAVVGEIVDGTRPLLIDSSGAEHSMPASWTHFRR